MGKLKKSKRNQKRKNPLARPNSKSPNDTKSDEAARRKALPLIEKLGSTSSNDRAMALSAITLLCEDEVYRKVLLKEKLITIIMEQCLTDSNEEIVVEAFGVLRNIAVEEGYDVIQHLWRQNIWTAIESGLVKIQKSFEYLANGDTSVLGGKRADEKAQLQLLYDYTENIIMLLVVLASGSLKLYDSVFAKIDPVLSLVVDIVNFNLPVVKTSLKLHHSLLEFIYEFASESQEFIHKLGQSNLDLSKLQQLQKQPSTLADIYQTAINFHILEDQISSNNANNILGNMFNKLIAINLDELKLILAIPDNAQNPIQKQPETMTDIDQPLGGELVEKWQAKCNLHAIEIAVDVTTSIWELLATETNDTSKVYPTVFELVYPSLMELLQFEATNQLGLAPKLLSCLNNLCWLMLLVQPIPTQWHDCCLQIWQGCAPFSNSNNIEVRNDCLNAYWAIVKTIGTEVLTKITPAAITGTVAATNDALQQVRDGNDDQDVLLEWLVTSSGFLGATVESLAAHDSSYIPVVHLIASLLVGCIIWLVQTDPDATASAVLVECLNSFFDIFSDANYVYDTPVFVEQNYLQRLQDLEPQVKSWSKRLDKHRQQEAAARTKEAWNNLTRFIHYKASESR